MSEEKTHDLKDFMRQLSNEMAAEYDRIQKRATVCDPWHCRTTKERKIKAELLQRKLASPEL